MSLTLKDKTQPNPRPSRARDSATHEPAAQQSSSHALSDDALAYPAVNAFAPSMNFRVDLDMFRGPLDLLLYLVRKHELDIANVSVAAITDQYVAHLEVLQQLDVDDVGDFVELASQLIEIKSRMILPQTDDQQATELEEDPQEDLVKRLLEYKKYKDAASMLDESGHDWQQRYVRLAPDLPPREIDPAAQPIREVELWDLVSAMGRIMRDSQRAQPPNIVYDDTPIHIHMQQLHDRLVQEQRISFSSMFRPGMHKGVLIGVFLAILELVRNYGVVVEQEDLHSDLWLRQSDDFKPTLDIHDAYPSEFDQELAAPGKPR